MILLASGWRAQDLADALLIDPKTVCNHFRRYQEGGLPGLTHFAYGGSDCELSEGQLAIRDANLQSALFLSAKDMAAWMEETSWATDANPALLHCLGFVYKKPKLWRSARPTPSPGGVPCVEA